MTKPYGGKEIHEISIWKELPSHQENESNEVTLYICIYIYFLYTNVYKSNSIKYGRREHYVLLVGVLLVPPLGDVHLKQKVKLYLVLSMKLLEKEMATHSSILAWRIPWTEEPGGSQRVGHNWATSLSLWNC